MSTKAGLAALGCAVAFASCGGNDGRLPLIAEGDAVRIITSSGGCPSTFGQSDFDDSSWQKITLPMPSVPTGGVCMRAAFDAGATIDRYRWLTITLSTPTRAVLNAGKPLGADVRTGGGLDWSTDDGDPELAPHIPGVPSRVYTLDLKLFPSLLQAKNNVLALQIPATSAPVDINAVLMRDDVSADSVVQVTKGPYRLRPSPTSMHIAWESDRAAPSWLVVDGQQYDGGWSMHHEVEIDGLVPGRVYSFYVASAESGALPSECAGVLASSSNRKMVEPLLDDDEFWKYLQRRDACNRLAQAIHSAPRALRATAPDAPVRVAIIGDTRADASLPGNVLAAVAGEAPDLVIHTGDVTAAGADGEWQSFFDASAAMLATTPLAPTPGERDLVPWGDRFSQLFGAAGDAGRAYSLDLGSLHVALLDSTARIEDQAAWLDADLSAAEANGARHEIVVLHWGPWTAGARGASALATIVPIARRHGVQAIVSGHENIYEHGIADGQHYFITGGAGAPGALGRVVAKPTTVTSRALQHYLMLEVDAQGGVVVRAKDASGVVFDEVAL